MTGVVLAIILAWVIAGFLFWKILNRENFSSVYEIKQRVLYENSAEHQFVITGKRTLPGLTKDQIFTNALERSAQERKKYHV